MQTGSGGEAEPNGSEKKHEDGVGITGSDSDEYPEVWEENEHAGVDNCTQQKAIGFVSGKTDVEMTEHEIFGRRDSIRRSPPTATAKDRSKSLDTERQTKKDINTRGSPSKVEVYDAFKIPQVDGNSRDSKKRKVDSSPKISSQEQQIDVSKNLKIMQEKVEELYKFAKHNRNVHREVKQIARELKAYIHKVKSEYRHLIEKKIWR